VLAIGAPFGLIGSVTQGIVSGKSRSVNIYLYEDFLQTDAAVNPGNSGGPIVSMDGKVIGLAAAIKTRSGGSQGVGLAVSSKLAKVVAEQLIKNGVVRRPYIGVSVVDLDPSTAAKLKLKPSSGVLVTEVVSKSPGERGNIGTHDVITKVNGIAVRTSREMHRALLWAPIGQPIEIAVTRDGKSFVTKVAVEEQPDVIVSDQPPPRSDRVKFDSIGVAVGDLTAEAATREGLPKGLQGVIVTGVTKGSLAEQSGLSRGLIVVQVNKQPVASPAAFREAIEQSTREKGAVLRVLRAGGEVDFVIVKLQ
jgi:serine protease Do